MPLPALDRLDAWRDHAALLVRLAAAFHLVYGVQDNVLDPARMAEFERFLAAHGFPWVALSARVSVWAQLLAGVAYALGAATRWAALAMSVNFVVAIGMVHLGRPYPEGAPAVWMLSSSLFLLLHGAGRPSVDAWLAARRARRAAGTPYRARSSSASAAR